ncbi:MAG TPA: DNA-3-methyladenine glycosylase I [Chitinophagaceae bacterium]|nr:DNA-3-methyladenine glycosylase I [Chitinophagaceae bacterium]
MAASYCEYVRQSGADPVHRQYHDHEYGFPLDDDAALFARLVLEINQAGLSWEIILKKKDHFFRAFDGFDIDRVARFDERRIERLLLDPGIVRNRLKITSVIDNARRIQVIREDFGSFKNWLDLHHPMPREEWVALFRNTFRFTGGEIVQEFLMSTGYLPGAHVPGCPVYKKLQKIRPAWMRKA